LLGTVVQVSFDASPLGIGGVDDASTAHGQLVHPLARLRLPEKCCSAPPIELGNQGRQWRNAGNQDYQSCHSDNRNQRKVHSFGYLQPGALGIGDQPRDRGGRQNRKRQEERRQQEQQRSRDRNTNDPVDERLPQPDVTNTPHQLSPAGRIDDGVRFRDLDATGQVDARSRRDVQPTKDHDREHEDEHTAEGERQREHREQEQTYDQPSAQSGERRRQQRRHCQPPLLRNPRSERIEGNR
jgi:hypothetical protein